MKSRLPYLSSIGGLRGFPALGYYNATKFAVGGLSEALWQEIEPLGIKVVLVEPSGFRTDWAGRSANESKRQIAAYAATAGAWRKQVPAISGKQAGDPLRAAQAIIKAIQCPKPPHHLLLGNDAYEGATAKLKELGKEFSAWDTVARGADYPTTNRCSEGCPPSLGRRSPWHRYQGTKSGITRGR
jgi:hypothetical protein